MQTGGDVRQDPLGGGEPVAGREVVGSATRQRPTAARRPQPHGTSSFERLMTYGAAAALDRLPPTEPGAAVGPPRWPERFGFLVSAYAAEQAGNDEERFEFLRRAELDVNDEAADVGEVVARAVGVDDTDRELFSELFGWSGTASDFYGGLPPRFKPIWILQILCCALGYRRNTFGRYFPPAQAAALPDAATLEELAARMNEAFETAAADAGVAVGFVFLGQFVDHDITLDVTTRLTDVAADPTDVLNVRSPALDLDNVYADGPEGSPELYNDDRGFGFLLVGPQGADLARNHIGVAIIGDPRNDENTIVSQLHLHFLHFHNAVLRMIKTTPVAALWGRDPVAEPADDAGDFEFARRMVRWHYQWMVVNDWLPRIVEADTLQAAHAITGVPQGTAAAALPNGFATAKAFFDQFHHITCCGKVTCRPLMPVEFSAAAFRFAHSQVRSRYDLNAARQDVPLFVPRPPASAAFDPVPATDLIDWRLFFDIDPLVVPQAARQIDTWLSAQVFQLPFASDEPNLASRNLRRGARVFALPTGDAIANTLGVPSAIGPVATAKLTAVGMTVADAPLWFYILGEAEANGNKLGPVGGLLVVVTLLRLLACDQSSYVHTTGPASWEPVLVPSDPGIFTAADLLRIAVNERTDAFPD